MRHKPNHNKYSTSNHNNPQHQKNNNQGPSSGYPSHPAPGGPSTPQRKGFAERLREKFSKPPEKPATRAEVEQMKLDSQRQQYKFNKQFYTQREKELKRGNGGWQSLFSNAPPARTVRGTSRRQPEEQSWLLSDSNRGNDIFGGGLGGGEGALGMFGAGSQKKPKGYKSGIEDMF